MTGRVYATLVQLHPSDFRHQFGDQMLCTFDDMMADRAHGIPLCFDATVSLARQWFLRGGLWKICVSLALSAFFFYGFLVRPPRIRAWMVPPNPGPQIPAEDVVRFALVSVVIVCVILISIVLWANAVNRRRSATCHSSYVRSRSGTAALRLSKI